MLKYLIFKYLIFDMDTRISHISTYGNEIRVPLTYLITITLINNRKPVIQ